MEAWDLEPLVEGITLPREPDSRDGDPDPVDLIQYFESIYRQCHIAKANEVEQKKLQEEEEAQKKAAEAPTHTHTHTKEIVYIERAGKDTNTKEEHGHDDEDHDCPVCNASKPKKPTAAQH